MSGVHMWAPMFLFLWQLVWLQVQAAPIPELSMDSIVLTSIPLGPSKPWDKQNLAEDLPSNPQETSDQLPLQQAASIKSKVSSEPLKFLLAHRELQRVLPIGVKDVDLGDLITSEPPKKIAPYTTGKETTHHATSPQESPAMSISEAGAMDLQATAVPPKNPEVAFPPQESVQAQWPTIPPVDLGLTITPEHTLGAAAISLKQPTAPPLKPAMTFPLSEPVLAQQPTSPPLELEVPIIPEPTLEADVTALQPTEAPPKHPEVAFPPQVPVQAQQPTSPPLELGVLINTEPNSEAGATVLQPTAAPPKYPEVPHPPPDTIQAQQPTFPPLDLELTITPEPTLEADATALQQNATPPLHPEVTLQPPQLVQVQQATFSEVTATVLAFDMEATITLEPESSESVPPMTQQVATMNICELCSCNNGTLSCVGFGSNKRLQRVPEPSTYNGSFTVL
ncbi:unnamed protein product [Pipistrellus nathusii]|uniref:Leucine-rich repeat-containing protein 37 N-terminal domain-containing protein n=1 Tax=Pipistrellus nathusii TaxID=59473 RepID=A0ABN9ZH38_PIPNA